MSAWRWRSRCTTNCTRRWRPDVDRDWTRYHTYAYTATEADVRRAFQLRYGQPPAEVWRDELRGSYPAAGGAAFWHAGPKPDKLTEIKD